MNNAVVGKPLMFRWIILVFGFLLPLDAILAFPSTMYVATEVLNVREAPFPDAPVSSKLNKNEQVIVLDSLDGWGAIEDPDRPGETFWVSLRYLSDSPVKSYAPSSTGGSSSPNEDYEIWLFLVGLLFLLGGKGLLRLIGFGLLAFWFALL